MDIDDKVPPMNTMNILHLFLGKLRNTNQILIIITNLQHLQMTFHISPILHSHHQVL